MEIINEKEIPYRFDGVSGPKYLLRGPHVDIGLVVLMPGEDFNTHYHKEIEENFYTLEGSVDIYVNDEKMHLQTGDIIQVPPQNNHYLKNNGTVPWKALFVKAPYNPKDKVDVEWLPEK